MLCPQELTLAITAAANALYERLESDELAVLGAALVQLGDTVTTLAAQKVLLQSREGRAKEGTLSTGAPVSAASGSSQTASSNSCQVH